VQVLMKNLQNKTLNAVLFQNLQMYIRRGAYHFYITPI
jgi:hypothetical protein